VGRRVLAVWFAGAMACAAANLAFTVSMPQPANHLFHITLRCEGLKGELQDFKMPQWSPGYYGIGNYARNVLNFRAEDGSGRALPWEKVTRNTWRVVADSAETVVLTYDVFGNTSFPANSYLGEDRAFLSPAGLFVHPAEELRSPLSVTIRLPEGWKRIATGLEPARDRPGVFEASDFDVLYDSPILIGNQESLQFEVKGVPHFLAIENVASGVDRAQMVADLKSIVTAAVELMGDIPYRHYTFLLMGRGNGGIEHSNSSANQFDGTGLGTRAGYVRWLSFIAHEYFHSFNVKRIRPLALGPFDYDQENLTGMLWVSEGLSVYYQDILLTRAGLMTRRQYLEKLAIAMGSFESAAGRRYQSAAESSRNTWNAGSGVGGDRNTTISYYNNGAMLGAMLDLKIRASSGNRKSLDDVMRGLYRKYFVEKKRGFTDAEFRAECNAAAGTDLGEIFEYASTTKEMDYPRYFGLAGVAVEVESSEAPGGFLGLDTQTQESPPNEAQGSRLMVVDTVPGSPAAVAGLRPGDRILAIEGKAASASVLNDAIAARKPGDRIRLRVSRGAAELTVAVEVAPNARRIYTLTPSRRATPAQSAVLDGWLPRP
jgi:predicted metalloprotease with PDZ domain